MSAGLALVLALGLCACGGDSGDEGGSKSSANSALAKQNVYRATEIEIPEFYEQNNGGINVLDAVSVGDKVKVLLQSYNYGDDSQDIRSITVNNDGSGLQMISLQLPGQEDDGGDDTDAPEETTSPDGDAVSDEPIVDSKEQYSYHNYNSFLYSDDGKIYGVHNYNFQDYSNQEAIIDERHYYICCWDADGTLVWESEIELDTEEQWRYVQRMLMLEDGTISVLIGGDSYEVVQMASDGTLGARNALSEETSNILNNSSNMLLKDKGIYLVIYNDEADWTKQYIAEYNVAADTFGEPIQMPSAIAMNSYSVMMGSGGNLIYSTSAGVYSYNIGDAEGTLKMDFVNSDLNIGSLYRVVQTSDTSLFALYDENYDGKVKAAALSYVAPEEIPDKSVLVLAGTYVNGDIKRRVIEFNKASETARIVMKDYSQYNSYDDYEAGITQLNNDIIAGQMPDILIEDGLPVESYANKGLLANIGKLIEEDEELSQIEFMQNVFEAYSINGELYHVVPRFSAATLVAKTSLVGDGSDWSMEKMQQVLAGMGEGAQAFGEVARNQFMNMAMQYCGRDFIDVKTGKCEFDSEEFIAMMEFAKTLPEEINWDEIYGEGDYWSSYESQYRDNKTLLLQLWFSGFQNISYQLNGYIGEEFSFVGFPMESGNGSYISAYEMMVLSAKSQNLEEAWNFVRYYLTDEYQENLEYGLAVNKRVFLEQSKDAMSRPYYEDAATQERVEYDSTIFINGEEIIVPPLTQEQTDQMVAFIESINTSYYYNENVMNIINEEIGAFYSGQKNAKDTAAIIQNRVQLYVDENGVD